MKFLSLTVVEISLTKNLERKKNEQTNGRTNRRMPICNPTIQLVVVDLYTKYEVSIVNGCGDIFDEKVLRNYGRTDGRMDGRMDGTTDRCKPVYPPLFQSRGINTRLLTFCTDAIYKISRFFTNWFPRYSRHLIFTKRGITLSIFDALSLKINQHIFIW